MKRAILASPPSWVNACPVASTGPPISRHEVVVAGHQPRTSSPYRTFAARQDFFERRRSFITVEPGDSKVMTVVVFIADQPSWPPLAPGWQKYCKGYCQTKSGRSNNPPPPFQVPQPLSRISGRIRPSSQRGPAFSDLCPGTQSTSASIRHIAHWIHTRS